MTRPGAAPRRRRRPAGALHYSWPIVFVEIDALLSQLDHSELSPEGLDSLRAELAQLLECAARLRALPVVGVEPALGPQRWK